MGGPRVSRWKHRLIAMSADGVHAYVPNRNSNTVSVIDTATNSLVFTIPVDGVPWGVAAAPLLLLDRVRTTAGPGQAAAVFSPPPTSEDTGVAATVTNNTSGSGTITLTVGRTRKAS